MEMMSKTVATIFLGYIAAFIGFMYPDYFYTICIAIIAAGAIPIDSFPKSSMVLLFGGLCALSLL